MVDPRQMYELLELKNEGLEKIVKIFIGKDGLSRHKLDLRPVYPDAQPIDLLMGPFVESTASIPRDMLPLAPPLGEKEESPTHIGDLLFAGQHIEHEGEDNFRDIGEKVLEIAANSFDFGHNSYLNPFDPYALTTALLRAVEYYNTSLNIPLEKINQLRAVSMTKRGEGTDAQVYLQVEAYTSDLAYVWDRTKQFWGDLGKKGIKNAQLMYDKIRFRPVRGFYWVEDSLPSSSPIYHVSWKISELLKERFKAKPRIIEEIQLKGYERENGGYDATLILVDGSPAVYVQENPTVGKTKSSFFPDLFSQGSYVMVLNKKILDVFERKKPENNFGERINNEPRKESSLVCYRMQ